MGNSLKDWTLDHIEGLVVGLTVVLIAVVVILMIEDVKSWNKYVVDHHCRVTGMQKGDVITVITNGKVGVAVTPDKKIYKCDEGEVIVR